MIIIYTYWDDDINYFDVDVEVGKRSWMDVDGDDDGCDVGGKEWMEMMMMLGR